MERHPVLYKNLFHIFSLMLSDSRAFLKACECVGKSLSAKGGGLMIAPNIARVILNLFFKYFARPLDFSPSHFDLLSRLFITVCNHEGGEGYRYFRCFSTSFQTSSRPNVVQCSEAALREIPSTFCISKTQP